MGEPDVGADTIPGLAIHAAQRWPSREAIVHGQERVSFAALAERMIEAAAAFVAVGLRPGDRIAIWAENNVQWIVACLGAQAAGGVLVPLNTRFREGEVAYIIEKAGVVMAVAAREFLGVRHADLLAGLGLAGMRRVIPLDSEGWSAFTATIDDAARTEARRRMQSLSPTDLSDIMFTSGTTGNPKGAMATHGQTVRTAHLWAEATTIGEGDRFLILWPFFHCSGYKAGWVVNLAIGATTLPMATLDVPCLVEIVEQERVTFLPGPPTLFQTLLTDAVDRARLASLRVSITGASSVAPTLIESMRHELGIPVVLTGYGLTETCGTVTMSSPDDPPEIVTTSCGRALPGIEIRIADDAGGDCVPCEAGEVLVRGINVMTGYLDDPQATAEAIDAAGWLHTGDIGTLDAAGYLRITDRKKDVFIVGGFNCYPAEIEKMLLAHPAILHVAVVGVPDERMGEVGKAYVVTKPGMVLESKALIGWSRERMANFKVPRFVELVDALPANATGKVEKFRLGKPTGRH